MAISERARVANVGNVVDVRQAHYQESKERIHRALLNRLNLDRLNRVGRAQAEPEIRGLIMTLLDSESSNVPLSMSEREALITDVFHELFGLGPLEALLAKYQDDNVINLSDPRVLQIPPLDKMGTPMQLVREFGTREAFERAVEELQSALYQETA